MMFLVALRKELLEQWRSYRMLVTLVLFIVMGLLSPLFAKLTPEILRLLPQGEEIAKIVPPPSIADAVAQYIKNISQFGVILALVTAMGTVAQEKDKGTAALMLVKPLPRGAFLGAKFAAFATTFLISTALAGLACYYYTLLLFEPLDLAEWLALNGLMWLFLFVYVALTIFCSTLTRSQALAGGLAFGTLILLSLLGSLPKVGEYLPGQLLAWGTGLAIASANPSWPAVWISMGIIFVAFFGAWVIFEKQEL